MQLTVIIPGNELQEARTVVNLSKEDVKKLQQLEEALWHEDTRYDVGFMEQVLAADFVEFGRSGRTYQRADIVDSPKRLINAVFPLQGFTVRPLSDDVALVTYNSQVTFHGQVEYSMCHDRNKQVSGSTVDFLEQH